MNIFKIPTKNIKVCSVVETLTNPFPTTIDNEFKGKLNICNNPWCTESNEKYQGLELYSYSTLFNIPLRGSKCVIKHGNAGKNVVGTFTHTQWGLACFEEYNEGVKVSDFFVIEATTDKALGLPLITKEEIENYIETENQKTFKKVRENVIQEGDIFIRVVDSDLHIFYDAYSVDSSFDEYIPIKYHPITGKLLINN